MSKPVIQRRQINKVKVSLTFNQLNEMSTIDSKTIADIFEKEHYNVMRGIKAFPDFNSRFTALKIEGSKYKDISGKSNDMFILDKSTAILLIMGFTGKKAHKFKVALLETFDKLEQKVSDLKEKEIKRLNKRLATAKGFNELNAKGLLKDSITASYGRASNSEYSKWGGKYLKIMDSIKTGLFGADYYQTDIAEVSEAIEKLTLNKYQKISWERLQAKYN